MTIGVLILSHEQLGQSMLDVSVKTISVCPLATRVLGVSLDEDPDMLAVKAQTLLDEVNSGDGVLVLTDLCGGTPANIASRLAHLDDVMVVAGLNLPMLIRVLNYPELSLAETAERAVAGGRQGIMLLPGHNEA
ncbi:MAG TPA: PTS sugar transporter subunit IIA [Gammaproteobacteria bacterium]|nr:PTS sugar transporter subunit IIA [Gammaproteobacteria bacterium]